MRLVLSSLFILTSFFLFGQSKTTITVLVPNPSDEVYIVGNQLLLGNWEPNKVKLNKISNYEREIQLDISFPAEFKFTRGTWESEGIVVGLIANSNILLDEKDSKSVYIIKGWSDEFVGGAYSVNYKIESLDSKVLDETRTYKLFLPKNYSENKKYPVFYITDAGWGNFDIALNYINLLAQNSAIPEVILIGIVQKDRGRELDVFWSEGGIQFKNYLFQELIPHIDKAYSTSGFNTIIGHSDGAEYNHLLMLEKDNPFRGFINLSTNLNKDVTNEISTFFKSYKNKNMYYFIASGIYDSEDRLKAGKRIDSLFKNHKNSIINFKHQIYKADHNNLVSQSMLDGISYVFKDYRNLEPYKDFKSYSENYIIAIQNSYGFEPNFSENDIDFYFGKILDQKDLEAYTYFVEYSADKNIFKANTLDRANHYFYMENYPKTVEFWNKTVEEFIDIDPHVFYYNFPKAIDAYLKEKDPKGALVFLEKSKERLPEQKLVFNYFIVKTAIENNLEKRSYKKAFSYCEKYFKGNRYFTLSDLNLLKAKK